MTRRIAATCTQIPHCEVDTGNRLRKRTRLARLKREHRRSLCQSLENLGWRAALKSGDHGSQNFIDQTRPVFGAIGRKVCPDFTPAGIPVGVLNADEHCGAVQHAAK